MPLAVAEDGLALADLIGRAPGKLLLFGEHAAVYGEPAIGISLPWTAELRITRLDAAQYVSCERLPPLPAALAAMLAEPPYAAEIEIRSHIPIELGVRLQRRAGRRRRTRPRRHRGSGAGRRRRLERCARA